MSTAPGPGRTQFLIGSAALAAGMAVTSMRVRGTLGDALAVPLAAAAFAAFAALTVWGAIRASSKRAVGGPLAGTGSVLLFVGAVGFVVYLAQPWRRCDYGDVGADCTALPADVTGLGVSVLVALCGGGLLAAHGVAAMLRRSVA